MSFARTLATPALRGTTEEQLAAARAKRSALVEKLKQAKGGPAEYTYESLVEQNDRYVAELEKMIGQSRPDDLLRRIAELESLLAGCDRTRSDAVEAMRRERDGLQRMNEGLKEQIQSREKRLNQLEKLKDRLPDENVSAQIAKTQKGLSELLAQHDLQVVELNRTIEAVHVDKSRLETDILRKQNELAAARKQTDELNRTIAELARKAQTSGDEIRAKETAIAELKEGFEQARKSLSEVTAAHSEELRELAAMRQTQASLLAERQALAAKIQECSAYVQSSQTGLSAQAKEIEELKRNGAALENSARQLAEQKEGLAREREELSAKLTALSAAAAASEARVAQLSAVLDQRQAASVQEQEGIRAEKQKIEIENGELAKQQAEAVVRLAAIQAAAREVESRSAANEMKARSLSEQLDALKKERETLEAAARSNAELFATTKAANERLTSEAEGIGKRIVELETKLREVIEAKNAEESAREQLQAKTDQMGARVAELEARVRELEEKKRQAEEKVAALEAFQKDLQEKYDQMKREMVDLREQNERLESQRSDLERRLAAEQAERMKNETKLRESVSALTKEKQKLETERAEIEAKLGEAETDRLQSEIAKGVEQTKAVQSSAETSSLKTAVAALELRIKEKDDELDRTRTEIGESEIRAAKTKEGLDARVNELEASIREKEAEGETERVRFKQEKESLLDKLAVSDREKEALGEQITSLSERITATKEGVGKEIEAKQARIKALEAERDALLAGKNRQAEEMHKAMAESSAALEKLGKENEKSLAEYRSAADRVKAQYDADRANLAEMNRILSARLDAKEKEVPEKKEEVPEKKVPEKKEEKIYEFVPIVASQEGAIKLLSAQLEELRKGQSAALDLYSELTKSVGKIVSDIDEFKDTAGMRTYVAACTIMHQTWKTLFRIPVSLRSAESEMFRIDAPPAPIRDGILSLLPASVRPSFRPNNRIDVLMYFLSVALLRIQNQSTEKAEYADLLRYIRDTIGYSVSKLPQQIQAIRALYDRQGDAIRARHDEAPGLVSFVRLTANGEVTDRIKVTAIDNRVLHVQYDDQPVALYDRRGSELVRNNVPSAVSSEYYLGPFNKVFGPELTNPQIVNDEAVRRKLEIPLRSGVPVSILPIGVSGSGKTTAMIKAEYTTFGPDGKPISVNEPGILLQLASNLTKSYEFGGKSYPAYSTCSVAIYEYETDPDAADPEQSVCRKYPGGSATVHRIRIKGDGTQEFDVPYDPCTSETKFVYRNQGGRWRNESGDSLMEDDLVSAIDVKRSITPTPLNPNSSRSHVVVILEFGGEGTSPATMVACDLAGAENAQDCSDPAQLDVIGHPALVEDEEKRIIRSDAKLSNDPDLLKVLDASFLDSAAPVLSVRTFKACSEMVKKIEDDLAKIALPVAEAPDSKSKYLEFGVKKSDTFNIRLIADYRSVSTDTKSRYAFKPANKPLNSALAGILAITKKPEWIKVQALFTALTGESFALGIQIPELVRIAVWYRTELPKAQNSLLRHSILSLRVSPTSETLLPKDEILRALKRGTCERRVREGKYINRVLYQLRLFIAERLRASRPSGYAPFRDECAPIQCAPDFRDCFGKNDYYDPVVYTKTGSFGQVVDRIMSVPRSNEMVWSVFLVVNLSKGANNPPPSPFIDVNDLLVARERLKSALPKEYSGPLGGSDVGLFAALRRLRTNPLLAKAPASLVAQIGQLCDDAERNPAKLDRLISVMDDFNSITAMGSMLFLDMMAKDAAPMPACNVK